MPGNAAGIGDSEFWVGTPGHWTWYEVMDQRGISNWATLSEEELQDCIDEMLELYEQAAAELTSQSSVAFWLNPGFMPGNTCEDCGIRGLDVKSRYTDDPLRCEDCHKLALLKRTCSS